MSEKQLSTIVSKRNWQDLGEMLRGLGTVELLSPMEKAADLLTSSSRELLDVVFIDADEYFMSPNGVVGPISARGIYPVFISDRLSADSMRAAMRAGAKDFMSRPFSQDDLKEVFVRAAEHRNGHSSVSEAKAPEKVEEPHKGQILTFFSTKGGAGKSTLAANLAVSLADKGACKVCLVDLSLQFGDLSWILNIKPRATMTDVVSATSSMSDDLASCLCEVNKNVHLLAAPLKPEEAELVTPAHITRVLDLITPKFDYIIVDTAASFHDVSLAALDRSDRVFLVVTPTILAVKDLIGTLEVMKGSLGYPEDKMSVVLNRSDSPFGINSGEIEKLIKMKIGYSVPSDGNIVVQALNKGVPVVTCYPKSKFTKSITDMARTIGAPVGVKAAAPAPAKQSFFKSLFKPKPAGRR